MAAVTTTFVTKSAGVNREELGNVVNRITPEDTPLYSMMKKGKCNSVYPEEVVDDLAAPAANAQLEGDQYSYAALTAAKRIGNPTQIFRKGFLISGTQEAVSNAASVEKMRYQTLKKGVEIRKDIELAIASPTPSVKVISANTARKLGGLPTWLITNDDRGASGTDGGFKTADSQTDAPGKGTVRDFTKDMMDKVMQSCYEKGGNVKSMVCSPKIKSVFVTFMSDSNVASFRYQTKSGSGNSLVATVDMYEGPFGKVRIVPNRVMTTTDTKTNAFFIDPGYIKWRWLRKLKRVMPAATGDARRRIIIGEGTLCMMNEAAHGVAADLKG